MKSGTRTKNIKPKRNKMDGTAWSLEKEIEQLNPEQREAVQHFEGPMLVLAGAGSGKTRVLTVRIANLVETHGVPPGSILALTFTNKAAGEMKERITRMIGGEPGGMWVGTFHSFGAWLLRRHADQVGYNRRFSILDADESLKMVKRAMDDLGVDKDEWKPKAIQGAISSAKNALVAPDDYERFMGAEAKDAFYRVVKNVYHAYQTLIHSQNAFDFDDLLVKSVELFRDNPETLERYRDRFPFISVDEYQDTNHAQFEMVEMLATKYRNIMVVGDDDQSIYGWRGADVNNILDFEQTFGGAKVVRLEENYRCTSSILEAANAVIKNNQKRKGKTLRTQNPRGEKIVSCVFENDLSEGRWIVDEIERLMMTGENVDDYNDIAILYRTNAQSRVLEEAFRRRAIPYQIVGGLSFYERREIKDVMAYLKLISNPQDMGNFERIVNYPRRGFGKVSQERLLAWARKQNVSPLEAARRADEIDSLGTRAKNQIGEFANLIDKYSELAKGLSAGTLVERLVDELDLIQNLVDEGLEGEERAENVRELISGAVDFDAEVEAERIGLEDISGFTDLDLFLQQVSLITELDTRDPDAKSVLLMTLHSAKGLEFPVVFVAGLEEGLFPHERTRYSPDEFEEERRLFYVGITRAQKDLYFTHALERRRAGDIVATQPSTFLKEVPQEIVDMRDPFNANSWRQGAFGGGYTPADPWGDSGLDQSTDDFEMNQDLPDLRIGDRVIHPRFGGGILKGVEGRGANVKVVVDFEGQGRKKLVLKYAGLEKDDSYYY